MTEQTVGDIKDLEAIDIFLFSNGDHKTPPRKYHLNTDAFLMWDDTLKSLGRSHFGSDDAIIDIYTISGHKIEEPSQLIDQAAYVAVKPHSSFIQTGYENYLIRATRSWEKRLLKISNNMDSSTKGNTESVLLKSQVNNEHNETQNYGYQKRKEVSKPTVADKIKRSIVRPYIVNIKPPQARENSNCAELKRIQRKKTCFTPQITALRQKNTPFKITSASKRVLINTKENLHKKPSDMKKIISATTKDKVLLNNSHTTNQDNEIFPSNNITSFNIVDNIIDGTDLSNDVTSANLNHGKIDNYENNNITVNEEKIIISNIYKNPQNEYVSITEIKYDDAPNKIIDKSVENKSMSYADIKCIKTSCTCYNGNCSKKSIIDANATGNKSNVQTSENDTNADIPVEIQTCVNCCQTRKQLDHFVAILNNDKVLKLHLNLEIKNCSVSVISDQLNNNTTHETQTYMTVIKTEKETQVNFYEQSNEHIYQDINKIKYSTQHSDEVLKDIIKDDNKIVIINCSGCDCVDLHRLPQYNVSCKDIFNEEILYDLASAIEANRCECRNYLKDMRQENNPSPIPAAGNREESVDETLTITSVQKLSCNPETNTCNNTLNSEEFPNIIAAIDEYSNQMTRNTENIKEFNNTSTQTNWCNMMLEARHREEGRYSFHLPPLYKIKNYNID